jgi:hypothetical protein
LALDTGEAQSNVHGTNISRAVGPKLRPLAKILDYRRLLDP